MASVYDLKPAFQNLLRPICKNLAKKGVTANQVTVGATILSGLAGLTIYLFRETPAILYLLPVILFVRMALNAIDGMMARECNMKSSLGAILNELGDVISDVLLYAPLAWIAGIDPLLITVITVLAIISEMAGLTSIQIGGTRRYDGPMGKSDRAFWFGLLGLLLASGINAGIWIYYYLGTMIVLLVITIINRVRKSLQEVS